MDATHEQHPGHGTADTPSMKDEQWKLYSRVYEAKTQEEQIQGYADWAPLYEESQALNKWQAPAMAARLLHKHLNGHSGFPVPASKSVLDIAAGTGLVGATLKQLDPSLEIYALDQSPDMLEVAAEKNVYTKLFEQSVQTMKDPSSPLQQAHPRLFAGATCVGSINPGHIEPDAIRSMVAMVEPDAGLFVATLRYAFWPKVKPYVDEGEADGSWRVLERYTTRKAVSDDDHVHVCLQRLK